MSRRRVLQAFGLSAALLATGSGAKAAAPPASDRPALLFPILVEPPATSSTVDVASGGALFSQPFRSQAAVRLTAPYRVVEPSGRAIDLPEGAILAMAAMPDETVFCTPGSNGARGILAKGDIGVCFRDGDNDGVFDGEALLGSKTRARTAYELTTLGWSGWRPAKAAYAPMRPDEIPPGRIAIRYFYVDPPLGKPQAYAELHICAPDAMAAPIGEPWAWAPCGALLDRGDADLHQGAKRLDLKAPASTALAFGPITAAIQVGPNGLAATSVATPFPAGRKLLMLVATYGHPGDPATQTSIFALLPAAVPASGQTEPLQ